MERSFQYGYLPAGVAEAHVSEVGVPSGVVEMVHVFHRVHRERQRVTEPETHDQ